MGEAAIGGLLADRRPPYHSRRSPRCEPSSVRGDWAPDLYRRHCYAQPPAKRWEPFGFGGMVIRPWKRIQRFFCLGGMAAIRWASACC